MMHRVIGCCKRPRETLMGFPRSWDIIGGHNLVLHRNVRQERCLMKSRNDQLGLRMGRLAISLGNSHTRLLFSRRWASSTSNGASKVVRIGQNGQDGKWWIGGAMMVALGLAGYWLEHSRGFYSLAFSNMMMTNRGPDLEFSEAEWKNFTSESNLIGELISLEDLNFRYQILSSSNTVDLKTASNPTEVEKSTILGRGAYGHVVRARDRAGRQVAIKIVPVHAMKLQMLKDEVEALKLSRQHPNVAELIEVLLCEETGCYYIITEFCAGGELFDRLIENGPYTEEVSKILIERIASALSHIHACGYAHCDVKPENLLFATKHPKGVQDEQDIRLVDFGMAKSLAEFQEKGYTYISANLGTTPYLSPEVLSLLYMDETDMGSNIVNNNKNGELPSSRKKNLVAPPSTSSSSTSTTRYILHSDPRACDMWALGVIMYIILLGCHPFDRRGTASDVVIAKRAMLGSKAEDGNLGEDEGVGRKGPRFTFDVHKKLNLSNDAKDLMMKLLDPDPSTRLTSADVLKHPWVKTAKSHERAKGDNSDGHRAVSAALLLTSLTRKLMAKNEQIKEDEEDSKGFLKSAYDVLSDGEWESVLRRASLEQHMSMTFEDFRHAVDQHYTEKYTPGSFVFRQGDEANGLYIIISGKAQLEYTDSKGVSTVVANLQVGDMFGETAVLDGRDRRNATVRCSEDGPLKVVFWSREDFINTFDDTGISVGNALEGFVRQRQTLRARLYLESMKKSTVHKKAGDILYLQGEASNRLYIITKGSIEMLVEPKFQPNTHSKKTKSSNDSIFNAILPTNVHLKDHIHLRDYTVGDLVGVDAVNGQDATRVATARCRTDVTLDYFPSRKLVPVLQQQLSLYNNLLRLHRREVEEKITCLRNNTIDEKARPSSPLTPGMQPNRLQRTQTVVDKNQNVLKILQLIAEQVASK